MSGPAVFALPWDDLVVGFALAIRATTFVMTAPVVGARAVPARVRIGLALLLALVVSPPPPAQVVLPVLVIREALVGLVIGLAGRFALDASLFAGSLAGLSSGLSLANVLDPVTQIETPTLGIFQRLLSVLVYISIGGHRQLLAVLGRSYELVPPGAADLSGPFLPHAVALTGRVLEFGVRIAAPVVITSLLVDLGFMLLARAAPQMHILIVGAPIKLAAGLLALAFSLRVLALVVDDSLDAVLGDVGRLLSALGGAA
ncbi:MAG: type III secretion protein [Acidobacteria bacterium]|nr:MAG: type III secretion protein [Acidobacteriota bacterium]